ncbi:TPA: phosphotransferase [Vibrio diabolicus]
MKNSNFWVEHYKYTDQELYNRFIALRPSDCSELLEELRLPVCRGIKYESVENRVFGFADVVLKFYRPERWDLVALQNELDFLEDIKAADIPFVRPIGEIGCWRGIYYLAFENIVGPYETNPKILNEDKVRQMVHRVARIHEVGAQREAKGRPVFNVREMCEGCFEVIVEQGYLPSNLRSRYERAVVKLGQLGDDFGTFPCQRIHGDSYSGNALWRADGPVLMDLDDFQMGPISVDLPLLSFPWRLESLPESMDRKERRKIQHQLVLTMYREIRPFDQYLETLIPLARGCRNVTFDAWMSARWNEPGFNEEYDGDDLTSEGWWLDTIEQLEKAANDYLQGWP